MLTMLQSAVGSARVSRLQSGIAPRARVGAPLVSDAHVTTAMSGSRRGMNGAFVELGMCSVQSRSAQPETAAKTAEAPKATPAEPPISALDVRVGRIISCEKHPDADSLYVEKIDVGEPEPRTIVSGLVKYVPLEDMQDRPVVILANLKPRNMRGIKSHGMVLCASDASHENVEPLRPPADAAAGERVWFGEGNQEQDKPETPNRIDKKKMWDALQPHLLTDGAKLANFKGAAMLTSAGPVTADSLVQAAIS